MDVQKSIRKGIDTVRSAVSTVSNTLNNMRPKKKFGPLAVMPSVRGQNTGSEIKHRDYSQRGGKKGGKKTKRNMRKRGTQKRR